MNIINAFFPFIDFLYILQLEEYDTLAYLNWVKTRYYKRNLQKVGKITWTRKSELLLVLIIGLFIGTLILFWPNNLVYQIAFIIVLTVFTPLYVALANIIFSPLDQLIKNNTIKNAAIKIKSLPECSVIAVAGSYGKTTTRNFIYQLLKPDFEIHTPQQNYNTLYSLSEDILQNVNQKHKYYLVELGEYKPGDLLKFYNLLDPEIVIITAIGSQHIATFGTQQNINNEFSSLVSVAKAKTIILNNDDSTINTLYGQDSSYKHFSKNSLLDVGIKSLPAHLDISHIKEDIAGAIEVAKTIGLENDAILARVQHMQTTERRMDVTIQNEITIIDDSYNINPQSAKDAFEYIMSLKGRKIVVTGGIVDQGDNWWKENSKFADLISQVADIVIVANNIFAPVISNTIKNHNKKCEVIISAHPTNTTQILKNLLKSGDIVLIQNELPDTYWN
jgi:UDP-N-acetylmuramoyl-tripeptide--D-alanyl-D-alanine ligase